MFVKRITINNFRIFREFESEDLNIPNNRKEGSGLTVFVGENGIGKSSLLAAFALTLNMNAQKLFGRNNFRNIKKDVEIRCYSESDFSVQDTLVGRGISIQCFQAEGSAFRAEAIGSRIEHHQYLIRADGRGFHPRHMQGTTFKESIALFLRGNRFSNRLSGNYSTGDGDSALMDLGQEYMDFVGIDIFTSSNYLKRSIMSINMVHAYDAAVEDFNKVITLTSSLNFKLKKFSELLPTRGNNQKLLPFVNIGSGYGAIFPLFYFLHMAKKGKRKMIIIIDEPELHLHPMLLGELVKILLRLSKRAQVILASHSPLLVKQLLQSGLVNDSSMRMLKKKKGKVSEWEKEERVLPYLSANEINYVAFNLATEEYHRELYEGLMLNYLSYLRRNPEADQRVKANQKNLIQKDFDALFFGEIGKKRGRKQNRYKPTKGDKHQKTVPDNGEKDCPSKATLHTYVRNQIHHSASYRPINHAELAKSIDTMRKFFAFPEGKNPPEE